MSDEIRMTDTPKHLEIHDCVFEPLDSATAWHRINDAQTQRIIRNRRRKWEGVTQRREIEQLTVTRRWVQVLFWGGLGFALLGAGLLYLAARLDGWLW